MKSASLKAHNFAIPNGNISHQKTLIFPSSLSHDFSDCVPRKKMKSMSNGHNLANAHFMFKRLVNCYMLLKVQYSLSNKIYTVVGSL
jgi:hypothetical protein